MGSAEVLADCSLDLSFGNRPHHPPALRPILEEDQQWNTVDAERSGRLRVLVDVELAETDVLALGGQLLDERSDHPAGSAPRRPEIDDRLAAADGALEVFVAELNGMAILIGSQRCLAPTANRCLSASELRNAVCLAATGTANDVAHA